VIFLDRPGAAPLPEDAEDLAAEEIPADDVQPEDLPF